jgi:hypothetical protein
MEVGREGIGKLSEEPSPVSRTRGAAAHAEVVRRGVDPGRRHDDVGVPPAWLDESVVRLF